MENWKQNWPDKLFKLIIAILSIVFGAHEYSIHQEAKKIEATLEEYTIETDDFDVESMAHTDLLQPVGE